MSKSQESSTIIQRDEISELQRHLDDWVLNLNAWVLTLKNVDVHEGYF